MEFVRLEAEQRRSFEEDGFLVVRNALDAQQVAEVREAGDRIAGSFLTKAPIDDKPAYTFSEDTPGAVTGDGFSDDFDGRHFVWSVVAAGDVAATPDHAPAAPPANDYGY